MSVALRLGGRPRAAPQCEIVIDDVLYVYTRKNNVSGWRNQWMVQFRPESAGGKWMACYIKNGQTDDEDTIAQEIRKKLEKVAHTSAPAPAPAASVPSPLHTRAPNERTAAELHNISPSKVGARHQCNRPTHEERVRTTRRRKKEEAKRRVTSEESGADATLEGLATCQDDSDEDDGRPRTIAKSVTELVHAILPDKQLAELGPTLKKHVNTMGLKEDSVGAMGYDRRRTLARVAVPLVRQVLDMVKAGTPDPAGVLKLVANDRAFKDIVVQEDAEIPDIYYTVSDAYKIAVKTKDKRHAKQMLSLLVCHLTDNDVIDLCSDAVDLVAGAEVRVLVPGGKGRQYRRAIIQAVDGEPINESSACAACELYTVKYFESSAALSLRRYATDQQHAEAVKSDLADGGATFGEVEEGVVRRRIKALGATKCTRDQCWKARVHAAKHYPGALPTRVSFTRRRLVGMRAEMLARALTPGGGDVVFAEASNKNVFRGVRYMRVEKRKRLWRKLVAQMEKRGLKPVDYGAAQG